MDHPSLQQQVTTTSTAAYGGGGDPTITTIIKRKRTKRHRQQSSMPPFATVTHSSTSFNTFNSSPASSCDFSTRFSTTTEEEDTANCLILLSKGHTNSISNNNNNITNIEEFSNYKFNSKRYIQTSSDNNNNNEITGMYVYECKTCSRTFPSFQALGGHRASHKKPRINDQKPPRYTTTTTTVSDEDHEPSTLSLQFNHKMVNYSKKLLSNKLHECSICGTEFTSGQALGGHMRRHRAANPNTTPNTNTNTNTNTTLSLVPYNPDTTMMAARNDDGLCLDLDLNLPAPPETAVVVDEQPRESSFKFTVNQGVQLSTTPTLVDCLY